MLAGVALAWRALGRPRAGATLRAALAKPSTEEKTPAMADAVQGVDGVDRVDAARAGGLTVVDHPLAGHLLADLRDAATEPERFRFAARRLATVLVLEATRDLPILRAGLGMLEAVTDLLPEVAVGYVGLERDETTLQPTSYYLKVPALEGR